MEKKYYDNLNFLKFIAIIMVIAQHIPLYDCDFINNGKLFEYCLKLLNEGVPIFMFVNGFLLFRKEELDIKKHYIKALKMLILVFIWAAIFIAIGMKFDKTAFNLGLVIDLFFRIGGENAVYTSHLWFMQALISIYLIFPLLWLGYKNNKQLFKNLFFILLFFCVADKSLIFLSNIVSYSGYSKMLTQISTYLNRYILVGNYKWQLLFFMMGGYVYLNQGFFNEKKRSIITLSVVSYILSCVYAIFMSYKNGVTFSQYYNATSVFELFIVLGMYCATINYKNCGIIGKYIDYVGINTLGIYFVHMHMLRIVALYIPTTNLGLRYLNVLMTLLVSTVLTWIIKKIPYINKLLNL